MKKYDAQYLRKATNFTKAHFLCCSGASYSTFFLFFVKNRKKDDREGAYTSAVYPVYPPCTFSKSESEFREGRALL
jgi:hypothetical protein